MSGKRMTKGSFTIEMSVYVPIFLLICLVTIRTGIKFYKGTELVISEYGGQDYWITEDFYRLNWLREIQKNAHK